MSNWIKISISSIKPEDLDIGFVRFKGVHMHLLELFDQDSLQVQQFIKNCVTILECINKVLTDIKYPFDKFGKPTNHHVYKAFKKIGNIYHRSFMNKTDYWQKASETVWLKMGDCEDSSILMHTIFLMRNIDCLWCIGLVYLNNKLLGGHGWEVAKLNGKFRLIETTLEQPVPSINFFPEVNINETVWKWKRLTYVPILTLWKKDELWLNKEFLFCSFNIKDVVMRYLSYKVISRKLRANKLIRKHILEE